MNVIFICSQFKVMEKKEGEMGKDVECMGRQEIKKEIQSFGCKTSREETTWATQA
jgi:hypothetical protein